jgi:hypothetical protein
MLAGSRRGFGAGAVLLSQLNTMRKRPLYRSRCVRRGGFQRRQKAKNAEDSQRSGPCTSSTLTSNISETAPTSALPVSVIARSDLRACDCGRAALRDAKEFVALVSTVPDRDVGGSGWWHATRRATRRQVEPAGWVVCCHAPGVAAVTHSVQTLVGNHSRRSVLN